MSNLPPRITPPPLPVFTPQPPSAKTKPTFRTRHVSRTEDSPDGAALLCVLMIGALAIWLMVL